MLLEKIADYAIREQTSKLKPEVIHHAKRAVLLRARLREQAIRHFFLDHEHGETDHVARVDHLENQL